MARLREGTGLSDKAQGCCNKCCEACCRLSPWNKLMCYPLVLLTVASLLMIIGGAFAAQDTNNTSPLICGPDTVKGANGSSMANRDPWVPLIRKNANVWWLANAGIFALIMLIMSFCCCGSFIALCCGFSLPKIPRILAVIGFLLTIIGLLLFLGWLVFGSWLITTFGPQAVLQSVCRGVVVFVMFMYIYLIIFVITCVAASVWACHGAVDGKDGEKKKSRDSAESKPKMPSTTLIKAMI